MKTFWEMFQRAVLLVFRIQFYLCKKKISKHFERKIDEKTRAYKLNIPLIGKILNQKILNRDFLGIKLCKKYKKIFTTVAKLYGKYLLGQHIVEWNPNTFLNSKYIYLHNVSWNETLTLFWVLKKIYLSI